MKTVNKFFAVISPHLSPMDYACYLKEDVKRILGHYYQSAFSLPHISLSQFLDFHTDSLLYELETMMARQSAFLISLRDFGVFRHGANGSIVMNIDNQRPIGDFTENVWGYRITPQVTIARNLPPHDLDKAWTILKNIPYQYSFICDHITVLIRNHGRWEHYTDLYFSDHHLN